MLSRVCHHWNKPCYLSTCGYKKWLCSNKHQLPEEQILLQEKKKKKDVSGRWIHPFCLLPSSLSSRRFLILPCGELFVQRGAQIADVMLWQVPDKDLNQWTTSVLWMQRMVPGCIMTQGDVVLASVLWWQDNVVSMPHSRLDNWPLLPFWPAAVNNANFTFSQCLVDLILT